MQIQVTHQQTAPSPRAVPTHDRPEASGLPACEKGVNKMATTNSKDKLVGQVAALGGIAGERVSWLMATFPSAYSALEATAKEAVAAREAFDKARDAFDAACIEHGIPSHAVDSPAVLNKYGTAALNVTDLNVTMKAAGNAAFEALRTLDAEAQRVIATPEVVAEVAQHLRENGELIVELISQIDAARERLATAEKAIQQSPELKDALRSVGGNTFNGSQLEHARYANRMVSLAEVLNQR